MEELFFFHICVTEMRASTRRLTFVSLLITFDVASSFSLAGTAAFWTAHWQQRRKTLSVSFMSKEDGKNWPPSKSDLYSDDELSKLLNLHQTLEQTTFSPVNNRGETVTPLEEDDESMAGGAPSLHDLVLQTLEQVDHSDEESLPEKVGSIVGSIDESVLAKVSQIRMIASDVDGTLLTANHELHPRTKNAIQKALEATQSEDHRLQYFVPATGKTRTGALSSLGDEVGWGWLSKVPGAFVQGLYCVDAQGNVISEQRLNVDEIREVEELSRKYNLTLFAYDGDSILVTSSSNPIHISQVHDKWGEPVPIVKESITTHKARANKLILMDDNVDYLDNVIRPQLEQVAKRHNCTVTRAVPTMLELLPPGCSKAAGVRKLCYQLGIDPRTELLAIGDAENDVEMLQMAAIGVAVGNAVQLAKDAADVVLEETNDEGGAGLAMELFGF